MSLLHSLRLDPLTPFNRLHAFLYSAALIALFYRHITTTTTVSSSFLFIADLVLAFIWTLTQAFRWRPVRRQEFTDRLLDAIGDDLPALDVFICTADPRKEPPMTAVNSALSVMAYDYPPEKLSVYVSDDGGSALTLFAFMEAAKFARHWLPFCRENGLAQRAPEAYFEEAGRCDSEKMKIMYKKMKTKVESAMEKGHVSRDLVMDTEEYDIFKKWKGFTPREHPSVIQVIAESSKDSDIMGNPIPNLVYVSREKRPTSAHNFKAGALNALTRVSCIMSNAPVVLTLDCDTFSNDPQTPRRALSYILDPALAPNLAFVQFPQNFQGLNKNDIYGAELKRPYRINARGMDGLRGPNFVGTGCFFLRRSLFGPPSSASSHFPSDLANGGSMRSDSVLKRAHEVAGCDYELDTKWGAMIGFRYGTLVEDYYTGYRLHCEGWKSVFCDPERPAFLGDSPKNFNDVLSQSKRWTVGLLEVAISVAISKHNPLIFGASKASLLMGMCYACYAFWGIWCIPVTVYALLPQLALIYDVPLFPKLSDPWFYLYAYLFLAAYCHELVEFLVADSTIQRWWSDQRIWMARGLTSFASGTIQLVINLMGLSAPGFSLTSKVLEEGQSELYDKGVFNFGVASPFFVSLGTVAILNLASFLLGILKAVRKEGVFDEMFAQLFISSFGVVNCWPVVEGMFVRRDGGKMPVNVTFVSILLAGFISSLGYLALAR